MADTGRQSFTDKAGSALKVFLFRQSLPMSQLSIFFIPQPDSQKGTLEQAGDYVKGKSDSVASSMQPNVSIRVSFSAFSLLIYSSEPEIW